MRILLAQINPTIGAIEKNAAKIIDAIELGKSQSADIVLLPELALSGYPPKDFLLLPHFIHHVERALKRIIESTKGITAIVGLPRHNPEGEKKLYNSAAVVQDQSIVGFQDKILLPSYDVFDERRYFEPASHAKVWNLCGKKIGITICEDIWQHAAFLKYTTYHRDPILELAEEGVDLVFNLSASPFSTTKFGNRWKVCSLAAKDLNCPLLFCNQVGGNDSLIFDGHSLYVGPDGSLLEYAKGFEEDFVLIDLSVPKKPLEIKENLVEDLFKALVLGVRDYFHKSGFFRACLGLSGGIDSALVACIAVEALGKENIMGVLMPSRYSSPESITDAIQLAEALGITYRELSIENPFKSYLELLEPHFKGIPFNAAEENIQARIRGMLLMALSNKLGYIVLSTGNKSELAMGYSTLYGDMCGGLGVISDVTKQQVYALSNWINRDKEIIPWNTIHKPPSAELRPNQKDSDSLPDYAIIDNVLQAYVEDHQSPDEIAKKFDYPLPLVNDLIYRIHSNEYKRRQSAPGLRISERAFSVGRQFPIVQGYVNK